MQCVKLETKKSEKPRSLVLLLEDVGVDVAVADCQSCKKLTRIKLYKFELELNGKWVFTHYLRLCDNCFSNFDAIFNCIRLLDINTRFYRKTDPKMTKIEIEELTSRYRFR